MKIFSKNITFILLVFFIVSTFVSCQESDDDTIVINETGTMTDIDGNIYKTVNIGNQWWMAENLEVTQFRNGVIIPEVTDSADWVNQMNGGYCSYENGNGNTTPPGLLYNWGAVSNSNMLAPQGWHIPSDEEWKELEKTLGMNQEQVDKLAWRGSNQGEKLKSSNQDDWTLFGSIFSTNESGFTALAGSCRVFNSQWGDPGLKNTGFWWSSSSYNNEEAWYRYLDYKTSAVFRSHTSNHYGFSVRCVKD